MKKETFYEKTSYENFVAISNLLVILSFVYPRSTKEFLRTCQNVSVHSRLNWNCWFLRRGEKRCTRGNTYPKKGENQQQTQPTYAVNARIWSRATSVGGKCPHHCTTLAPHCHLWGVGTNTGTFDVHHALIRKIMFSPLENGIHIFAPPRLISSIWNFINWPLWTEIIMKVNSLHNATWQWQKINFVQCTNICTLLKLTSDWHLLKFEAVIRKA